MKVHIFPDFKRPDKGEGGIRRVVEAQKRYLPEHGVELVDDPLEADVVNCHAVEWIDHTTVVQSCHGLYWSDNLENKLDWQLWALNANIRVIDNMKKAREVISPSRWVSNAIARGMMIDAHTIYHGIDLDEWTPSESKDFALWNKNRTDIICNPLPLNKLVELFPGQKFVSTYGNQAGNLNIIGRVPFEEMRNILHQCNVYIATTRETGGIGTLEAMACGKPILCFDMGANKELVTHKENGYIARYNDWEDLAEGFNYCRQHGKRLGENARQAVIDNFQWEDRIGDYVDVFQKALDAKKAEEVNPKVSVIITAYGLEQYLPNAIESVIQQDFEDWELIIVEDNSPDRCAEIADEYAENDKRIKVIHNETNQYLAGARNTGIAEARGKYVIPLDADDMLGSRALGILSRALDYDPDVDIVTGSMSVIESDKPEWISTWPPNAPDYEYQIRGHNMVPYASMYRYWVWERTGGYRRRMKSAEDADFWTRAMTYGAVPAKPTDQVTLRYLIRKDSMSHTIATPDWLQWHVHAKYPEFTPFGASYKDKNYKRTMPVYSYGPPLVSVIIPVGPGHEPHLQDACDSILNQTFNNWELILVNDTGKRWFDDNGNLLNHFIRGLSYATIIDGIDGESPKGPAHARNIGIANSSAPFFVLLDADDYAQPALLRALYQTINKFGGWVYPDWVGHDGISRQSEDWDITRIPKKMLGPVTGIYPRKAWVEVGGFDESSPGWEDWIFQLSLVEKGYCGNHLAYEGFTYNYDSGLRRENDFEHQDDTKAYIRNRFALFYEGDWDMGCGCGGGKRKVTISGVSGKTTAQGLPSSDMLAVEYTGPATQFQKVNSRLDPSYVYKYGGPMGHPRRHFYAFKEDIEQYFGLHKDFVVHESQVDAATKGADLKIKAEVRHDTSPVSAPVDVLDIDDATKTILKSAGYLTTDDLKVHDAQLLAIKHIGAKRLEQIRHAVSAFA